MRFPRRKFLHLAAGAAALPAVSWIARVQTYPSRPITMIVPFAPGGLTDVLGRVLAAGMQRLLVQSIVVENVGGASGSIGAGRVARDSARRLHGGTGYMEHSRCERCDLHARLRRREGFCTDRAMRRGTAGACGEEDPTDT